MSIQSVHLSPTHSFTKTTQTSITLLPDHGVLGDAHAGKTVKHLYNLKVHAQKLAKAQVDNPNIVIPVPPNLKQVHLIQVELFDEKGFDDESSNGKIKPGDLGENITTIGLNLVGMSKGTRLTFIDPENPHFPDVGRPLLGETITGNMINAVASDTTEAALLHTMRNSITWLLVRHFPLPSLIILTTILLQKYFHRPPPPKPLNNDPPSITLTGLRNPCSRINDFRSGLKAHCYVKDESGKTIGVRAGVMAVVDRGGIVKPGMKIVIESPAEHVPMERI
ncbi:MAG: hypothetical protein L6R40_003776 [Gallowayella cf. fulva]|nr:MAG: hypothetical protein L6R40_003776 [Xanthomendoza cf. fulva]